MVSEDFELFFTKFKTHISFPYVSINRRKCFSVTLNSGSRSKSIIRGGFGLILVLSCPQKIGIEPRIIANENKFLYLFWNSKSSVIINSVSTSFATSALSFIPRLRNLTPALKRDLVNLPP